MEKDQPAGEEEKPQITKEKILEQAPSAYEAVVAIAKEARRLNSAPEVFLGAGEKAIPKAVQNFVEGKVEYEVEENGPRGSKRRKKNPEAK